MARARRQDLIVDPPTRNNIQPIRVVVPVKPAGLAPVPFPGRQQSVFIWAGQ